MNERMEKILHCISLTHRQSVWKIKKLKLRTLFKLQNDDTHTHTHL